MYARTILSLPLTLAIALTAACGARDDAINDMEADGPPQPVVIQVENQSTQQATVYVIQDRGMRMRLGVVPAMSQEFFEHDVWLGRSLEFDIRLLAGGTHRTMSIPAARGDTVHVRIPPHL